MGDLHFEFFSGAHRAAGTGYVIYYVGSDENDVYNPARYNAERRTPAKTVRLLSNETWQACEAACNADRGEVS